MYFSVTTLLLHCSCVAFFECLKKTARTKKENTNVLTNNNNNNNNTSNITSILSKRTGTIINSISKLLKDKKTSVKVKTALFTLLIHFLRALGSHSNNGGISEHLNLLVPVLATCLRDRNGGMKLQILTFIQALVETHPSEIIRPHVATVLPAVVACAKEDWYKIIAQSIRVVGCFVNVLRPISKDDGGRLTLSNYSNDMNELLTKMFDVTSERLSQNDIDQEIKDCAVSTMGGLVAHFSDVGAIKERVNKGK